MKPFVNLFQQIINNKILFKGMKNEQKEEKVNVYENKIFELSQENIKLKDAVLFYKNKYLQEKNQKQNIQQKLIQSENQKVQIFKQYKQLLTIFQQRNQLQNNDISNAQISKEFIPSKIIGDQTQRSLVTSKIIQKKQGSQHHYQICKINTTVNLCEDLILKYILKNKNSNDQNQNQSKTERRCYQSAILQPSNTERMNNNQNSKKLMTLKQANFNSLTKKSNFNPIQKKISIPKIIDKKKNYFEKKKGI